MQAVRTSVRCPASHHTVGHRCLLIDGRDMLLSAQAGRLLLRLSEVLESAKAGAPEHFGTLGREGTIGNVSAVLRLPLGISEAM